MIQVDPALDVLFSVTHYIFFSKSLPCDDISWVVIPPLLLEYYEAKIQWHIFFFFWKAGPEIPAVLQNSNFHNRVHVGAVITNTAQIVAENSTPTIPIKP